MAALEKEIVRCDCRQPQSVYIGGGTPSCLTPGGMERLFSILRGRFLLCDEAEVSFEINPESLDQQKAAILRSCGVNRVSLGVQSMDARTLRALGRKHSPEQSLAAFGLLRSAGFNNINVDFIYGLPGQARAEVIADLENILLLGSEHLSLYALNIEERSLFAVQKITADQDAQADIYDEVCALMERRGVRQYEVSNFARPGFESRHNLHYWHGGEYVGLGAAAHSHLNGERFWNADTLPKYLEGMETGGPAVAGREKLPPAQKMLEEFLIGLRMNQGVDLCSLEMKFGIEMSLEKKEALESFMELGLLEEDGSVIKATRRGRLVLDEISARII